MEQKTPKRRGRKPINIDYEQVEHLASLNLGIMDICRSIGVGWDTFDKHRKKKGSELTEALERGKAKGLKRATTALAAKIEDGEFQAIQFYLKSADREKWAERAEINHTLNLAHILEDAQARIIELPRAKARAEAPHAPKVKRLENIKGKG
jgi:hypothetical protein